MVRIGLFFQDTPMITSNIDKALEYVCDHVSCLLTD